MNLSISKNISPGFSKAVKIVALGIAGGYFVRVAYIDLMRPTGKAELIGWVLGCLTFVGAWGLVLYYRMKDEAEFAFQELETHRQLLNKATIVRVEKEIGKIEEEKPKGDSAPEWEYNTSTDSPMDIGEATRKNRDQILDRVAYFFGIENETESEND